MTQDLPALVVGASGFVGSHITRLLVARERKVRVMVRASSKQEAFANLPVEVFYGDVLDRNSLTAAMMGCGSVFYCVVDPRFWLTDVTPIQRNNVEGLSNAINAALINRTHRFVFISTIGALGLNPGGVVTEKTPFNWPEPIPAYIRVRVEAETNFLASCHAEGLAGIALCVANTYGPQDYQPTPHNGALWAAASGRMPIAWDATQPTVDIRDVAEAALLAEEHGATGERYIISNESVTNRQLYGMAAALTGKKPPIFLSIAAANRIATVMECMLKLLRQRDSMISREAVYLSSVFKNLDSGKARTQLSWHPRPLEQTVKDAVSWFSNKYEGKN